MLGKSINEWRTQAEAMLREDAVARDRSLQDSWRSCFEYSSLMAALSDDRKEACVAYVLRLEKKK